MKALTGIPYARQAAQLISPETDFVKALDNPDPAFWLRVMHFEARYKSISQLLADAPVANILELSSGFSFRGLDAVQHKHVHYIDTDLPGVIEQKEKLMTAIPPGDGTQGRLELLPLNALEKGQFNDVINRFNEGELAIVNEGLLMYLDTEEKRKLCGIIHDVLSKRGGYWITADIYVPTGPIPAILDFKDELQHFLDEQKVEEKKFESMAAAEAFFLSCGFVVEKEAEMNYMQMEALPYLLKTVPPELMKAMGDSGNRKIQATWRLKVK